jgi:ActR/RegA family two-component response regulator
VAPSLAGVMGLNRLIATSETDWDTSDTARRLGLEKRRTVEQVLREKAALPPIR